MEHADAAARAAANGKPAMTDAELSQLLEQGWDEDDVLAGLNGDRPPLAGVEPRTLAEVEETYQKCCGSRGCRRGSAPRSTGDTLNRALDSKFSRHGSPLKEET